MKNNDKGIITLPNILSLYRLFLAPILFLALSEGMQTLAILVFLLSGLSDLADGFLARWLDEVSDLGKVLDPIADKTTYLLALLGLLPQHPLLGILLIALATKEILCGIASLIAIRQTKRVRGAKLHGKVAGAMLFSTVLLHLLFPALPPLFTILALSLTLSALAISCVLYLIEHLSPLSGAKRNIVEDFIRRM